MASRILIPFWIFEHVNWGGDDSPISKWFSPQLMPGGGGHGRWLRDLRHGGWDFGSSVHFTISPACFSLPDGPFGHILMRVNLLLLASGIYGPFFAMVTAAGRANGLGSAAGSIGSLQFLECEFFIYPLVNIQKAIENCHLQWWFTHIKWWFSIVTLSLPEGKCYYSILFQLFLFPAVLPGFQSLSLGMNSILEPGHRVWPLWLQSWVNDFCIAMLINHNAHHTVSALYFFWFDAVEIESRVLVDLAIANTLRATEGNKV